MPLNIDVGLSRKASKDYQSTGVSINVTAELDSALLAKPAELQTQIADLYAQAEQALDRQAGSPAPSAPSASAGTAANRFPRGGSPGSNGHRNGTPSGMTASQRRAIDAIAARINADAGQEAHDLFGSTLDELNIRQASELIDHLKALPPAVSSRNGQTRR
jgi:hypothetical protein